MLLNFELMKNGYVPIVIKKEQRVEYYDSQDFSHVKGNYSAFIQLVACVLEDTLNFYIRYV